MTPLRLPRDEGPGDARVENNEHPLRQYAETRRKLTSTRPGHLFIYLRDDKAFHARKCPRVEHNPRIYGRAVSNGATKSGAAAKRKGHLCQTCRGPSHSH